MNHCNDFAPCGPSIGQYNSYSYSYSKIQVDIKYKENNNSPFLKNNGEF